MLSASGDRLQIWGGAEYTCNRVGDRYFDQMELSGHAGRPEDYAVFAELGISTLRVGLLWERHELDPSWDFADTHLSHLRHAGIDPIVGLMHHGSGPSHTNLLDLDFPQKLADYAGAVAERYPHLSRFTPINEPHTTARFSGMYGLWYPHHLSRKSLFRALINQVKGIVLSMQAIRVTRPDAQLIMTDDFGRITGTPELTPEWENLDLRRWLVIDLLTGSVDESHALFRDLLSAGISADEVAWFQMHPCPPDIIGINYYPTSDRYLDHRIDLYPSSLRSAEGPFVDVEAVRCEDAPKLILDELLLEVWHRYRIPTAITELHLGGESMEQVRWAAGVYDSVQNARSLGAKCIAITFWALLGSFYWDELVTRENGYYEPGVFDVRSGRPEPTGLTEIVRQLAAGDCPAHPALRSPGWWLRDDRFRFRSIVSALVEA